MREKVLRLTWCPFLFVYGTLMGGFDEDLQKKVGAKLVGGATIRGRLYDLGEYPGAKLADKGSKDLVKGELYQLADPEHAIKIFDRYEEYFPSAPHKSLFVRKLVTVSLVEGGRKRKAWAYLYNRPVANDKLVPNGDYRNLVAVRFWS